jgi:hypothetical protein
MQPSRLRCQPGQTPSALSSCERMPTKDNCPALYDFLMGKAPSPKDFHKIREWLSDDTLHRRPTEKPTIEETRSKVMKIMAGIQGFCPEFVPTFLLDVHTRVLHPHGEMVAILAAASECGLVCNVESDLDLFGQGVNKHGVKDIDALGKILASPTCTIQRLGLWPEGSAGPRARKSALNGLIKPIENCPSLRVLSCFPSQKLFERIGKYSSIDELHLISLMDYPALLQGRVKEALVHALEMGRIETVSISASDENPDAYEFADVVDRVNLHGGKLKRVYVQSDGVRDGADGAMVRAGREKALKKLLASNTIEDLELPTPLWLIDLPAGKAREWIDQGRLKSLNFNLDLDEYSDNHWRPLNLTQSQIDEVYALAAELEEYVATRAQAEKDQALQAGIMV